MTQGAGQEPVVRTATLRDFRVPPYAQVPMPAPLPHPGNVAPGGEPPVGYTPTERDLPVINRGDTVQVEAVPEPRPSAGSGRGPLYVVGDVHGYLDELLAALREQGLVDADGRWAMRQRQALVPRRLHRPRP